MQVADFHALKDAALRTFQQRLEQAPPGRCWTVEIEVNRLESQLAQLYGIAALMARRETELERIAAIWSAMIAVCDDFARRVQGVCAEHPACLGSYDNILDIRNKCARLCDLHS
jgi:hypothetical protein